MPTGFPSSPEDDSHPRSQRGRDRTLGGMSSTLSLEALRGRLREDVLRIASEHGARSIAVFGSVARGEVEPGDVDFLVDFEPGSTLLDLIHLQDALEAFLGTRVDVVSVGGLKPRDDHIREQAVPL